MEQRANDLLLVGIERQIKEGTPTIAQALRKGSGVEMEIDVFGHLVIVEVRKHKISDKRF